MSATLITPAAVPARRQHVDIQRQQERATLTRRVVLAVIVLAHMVLSVCIPSLSAPFEDEGLYVSEGHLMIQQLLDPSYSVPDAPGAYFSGAPALYPVLAALADSIGGLYTARLLSLVFTVIATLAVYGMSRRLTSTVAALTGTAAFALSSPVLYQSHFATYDSMMLCMVAVAAWLAVRSVQADRFLSAPIVGIILLVAALSKYAGLVYAPIVVALAAAEGWRRLRWIGVQRAALALMTMGAFGFLILALWGQSMLPGFIVTTLERNVINPATTSFLLGQIGSWVGPLLLAGFIGALVMVSRARHRWAVALILLGASVIAPVQQLRIGESTSLGKHLAFGLIFAAPLIGLTAETIIKKLRYKRIGMVVVAGLLAVNTVLSAAQASEFLSSWAPTDRLSATLKPIIEQRQGSPVLGEQPAGERYLLREVLPAQLLADTYYLKYENLTDMPAYQAAINDRYFSVVWLNTTTTRGAQIDKMMQAAVTNGSYTMSTEVQRTFRGQPAGSWHVYTANEETK